MKKSMLSLAVASLVCAGVAEAKFYIGIEGGYTGAAYDTKDHDLKVNSSYFVTPGSSTLENTFKDKTYYYADGVSQEYEPWMGYNIALTLGSEHFFARNYLGFRWGASVGFTEIMQEMTQRQKTGSQSFTDTLGTIDTGLSLDLMINLVNSGNFSFGIFGGVEGDYHYLVVADTETNGKVKSNLSGANRHSMDFAGRVGLSTLLGKHHRFDITAKLPIGYVVAGDDNKVKLTSMPVRTSFNFGYKYVF